MATPFTCLECGAEVHPNARSCSNCDAVLEEARPCEVDLPDEDFNYEDFVKQEFGGRREIKPPGIPAFWWITAILVTILFFLLTIGLL